MLHSDVMSSQLDPSDADLQFQSCNCIPLDCYATASVHHALSYSRAGLSRERQVLDGATTMHTDVLHSRLVPYDVQVHPYMEEGTPPNPRNRESAWHRRDLAGETIWCNSYPASYPRRNRHSCYFSIETCSNCRMVWMITDALPSFHCMCSSSFG